MADLIQLDWDGKHYELEVDSIKAREFKSIKQHTGLKAGQFIRALTSLDDLDADVAVALLWLFKTKAGENPTFDDDVAVFKLLGAISSPDVEGDSEDPKASESTPSDG
jgi:hypothetical protein